MIPVANVMSPTVNGMSPAARPFVVSYHQPACRDPGHVSTARLFTESRLRATPCQLQLGSPAGGAGYSWFAWLLVCYRLLVESCEPERPNLQDRPGQRVELNKIYILEERIFRQIVYKKALQNQGFQEPVGLTLHTCAGDLPAYRRQSITWQLSRSVTPAMNFENCVLQHQYLILRALLTYPPGFRAVAGRSSIRI